MNRDDGVQKRLPIPNKTIITVQEECRKTNDDIRCLVGLSQILVCDYLKQQD
jgi:hypothetical protein